MALLDAYGREVKKGRPILDEIGVSSIRNRYSTYPSKGLTPERLARILQDADRGSVLRQSELFEEMEEKDTQLGSVLGTRKLAVTGLPWEVLPASDSAEDKKVADAAREMLGGINELDVNLMDILDAIGKGFSVLEIIWEIVEKRVRAERLEWIHQKSFVFYDRKGNLLNDPKLITDVEPSYGEDLLPNKYVYFRHHARSGATSRGGLSRPCAYMYLFKNYDIKDWVIFNERFAQPMRLGKFTPGASENDRKVLRDAVFNLGSDAAAVISDSTIIELLEQSGKRASSDLYERLAKFCDAAMSKVVLGHTGSSESTPGRLGGEESAENVRQDLLEADAKAVSRAVTLQLLRPWTLFNFGPDTAPPRFKLRFEAPEDLKDTAVTYRTLGELGVKIPVEHVYEKFGIPAPKKGDETVGGTRAAVIETDAE